MENRKLQNEELHRISTEEFKSVEKLPIVIVLDNIRSLNNVGSVFRTSDAFRLSKIYLCGITATPPNREIHKTALGAEESVAWEYSKDTLPVIHRLEADGYKVFSVEQAENSLSLEKVTLPTDGKYALVFGNEVKGVQQEVIDHSAGCIEIRDKTFIQHFRQCRHRTVAGRPSVAKPFLIFKTRIRNGQTDVYS